MNEFEKRRLLRFALALGNATASIAAPAELQMRFASPDKTKGECVVCKAPRAECEATFDEGATVHPVCVACCRMPSSVRHVLHTSRFRAKWFAWCVFESVRS